MKHIQQIIYSIVFAVGFGTSLYFAGNAALQTIGASACIGAIFGAMMTLIRDEIQRYHELKMQENEQRLSLGAMSHMAQVTFDKHVEFCEEYINRFSEIISDLFMHGPTDKALGYANDLYNIRKKYVLWINDEIDKPLDQLESSLRKMGADRMLLKDLPDVENRSEIVKAMYQIFKDICEVSNNSEQKKIQDSVIARSRIIDHLRELLGASDFVKIRKFLITKATEHPS